MWLDIYEEIRLRWSRKPYQNIIHHNQNFVHCLIVCSNVLLREIKRGRILMKEPAPTFCSEDYGYFVKEGLEVHSAKVII
jgi:hypothetical protein